MNNRQSWNIITLFGILIFGFTLATLIKPENGFSQRENRVLATTPAPKAKSVLDGSFEKTYEESLADQFVLRDAWIGLRTKAERATLKQEVHGVYFASDNYLVETHRGVFDTAQAEANTGLLAQFLRRAVSRYGEDHVTALIVPNAVEILEDKLPPFAQKNTQALYLAHLQEQLPAGCWFDARNVLVEHAEEQLYYRTDHHWTTLAAWLVFREWADSRGLMAGLGERDLSDLYVRRTLTDRFEGTVAAKIGSSGIYDTIEAMEPGQDLSYSLTYNQGDDVRFEICQEEQLKGRDKYSVFFGGNYGLIEGKTNAGTGRKILVIKDSYAHCFAPLLFPAFDEVDLMDLRYYNNSLETFLDTHDYTDVLFLYNAAGFAQDTALAKLIV